jgi:hypothetical protein
LAISGFQLANMWLATQRLAGDQNSITVWVGSASDDPDQGLVVRSALGDSVVNSTAAEDHLRARRLPIRGRGAHIRSADNKTGILTIAFAGGRTLRYDAIKGKALR